ncbi:hypothetical protein RRG08_050635 [Elysia crispata]|uniref:Uncharacterized protein n=1 Tax=Elysia crispata TaxID=231223 RepID=A0AAE1D9U9_9GAST|nr:hypothetical protein RRG08_050635 [Elysia crispata]
MFHWFLKSPISNTACMDNSQPKQIWPQIKLMKLVSTVWDTTCDMFSVKVSWQTYSVQRTSFRALDPARWGRPWRNVANCLVPFLSGSALLLDSEFWG